MNRLISNLYDAIYSPKITPHELLQNLNVDNYTSVNFYNKGEFIIAKTNCYLKDGETAEFIYTFDCDNHLQKLESKTDNQLFTIYSRKEDIANKYNELVNILKKTKAKAV